MDPKKKRYLPNALLLTCLILFAPISGAIPDFGAWNVIEEVGRDHPDSQPCNDQGILWEGLGNPIVAEAVRMLGGDACEKLMLDAAIRLVQTTDPVSAEAGHDGEITIRITFPILETPFQTPLRNQDPDTPTFGEDARRDASAAAEDWVPVMLDPNRGIPCSEGSTGAPSSIYVTPPMPWTLHARGCGHPEAAGPKVVGGPAALNVGGQELTVDPPRTVARVDRVFRLRVTGYVSLADGGFDTAYQTTLANVVLVNNVATETLAGLARTIEDSGHTVEDVTFRVEAFITEAQAATGDALEAATAIEPPVSAVEASVIITLPPPQAPAVDPEPAGETMRDETALLDAEVGSGTMNEAAACQPSEAYGSVYLTYENGCVRSRADLYEPGYARRVVDHQDGRTFDGTDLMVERMEDTLWLEMPAMAGVSGQTKVEFSVRGPKIQVLGADAIRITSAWSIRGDVDRRCDPKGSHCIASGASLDLIHAVSHSEPGSQAQRVVHEEQRLLYASPLVVCAAETPLKIPLYRHLQPLVGCFLTIWNGARKHQVQAFNGHVVMESSVVNLREFPGDLTPTSSIVASVCCTGERNMPSLSNMKMEFLGFIVEAV